MQLYFCNPVCRVRNSIPEFAGMKESAYLCAVKRKSVTCGQNLLLLMK